MTTHLGVAKHMANVSAQAGLSTQLRHALMLRATSVAMTSRSPASLGTAGMGVKSRHASMAADDTMVHKTAISGLRWGFMA
jgi:hypothetical protein